MPAAPTATVFPSLLTVFPSLINATDCPDSSPAVSPSMSAANSPQRSYGIHLRRPMPLSAKAIALMRSWGRAGERLVGGWPSRGRCDHVAYGETADGPPFLYNTSIGTIDLVLDPDGTMIKFTIRSSGHVESADGTLLYKGPSNFDITLVDGEPVGFVTRGPSGPCVPGID